MEKSIKDYVLACAKSQGKLSKLLLNTGEMDHHREVYLRLRHEIELLKKEFLKEDEFLAGKIQNIKKGGKINLGSSYTSWMGWGTSLNVPSGGWPSEKGGMVYGYDKETDLKPLPFGRVQRAWVGKSKGEDSGYFKEA